MTEEVQVDPKKLLESHIAGFNSLRQIYKKVLSPELLHDIEGLHLYNDNHFTFPVECWVKCVYSFAAYFAKELAIKKRNTCLEALRILWLGKVASFVLETTESDTSEAEEKIEEEFKVTITLADERAMAQKISPFKTIGTLADYVSLILEEETDG